MWRTFVNGCVLYMEVVQSLGAMSDAAFRVRVSENGEMDLNHRTPATSPDMLQRANDIHAVWRTTRRQLAVKLSVSNGSAMAIIDALGFSKVCARCVPRSLTTEHRNQSNAICFKLFDRFGAKGGIFVPDRHR